MTDPAQNPRPVHAPFAGKTALIFGASRGIGEAIVRRLVADGASVVFTYSRSDAQARALQEELEGTGRLRVIKADSGEADEVRRATDQAATWLGGLDIVVVNAGILKRGLIDQFSLEDFDEVLSVNFRGVFTALRYSAQHVRDGGRMVTIGSNTALRTGFPGVSVYSASKAAVAVLVRGAAIDLAPRRITVNNVQPGPTATELTAGGVERVIPFVPLARMGEPAEVAGMVAYLASEEAGFVTGASLTIDGGYAA